MEYEEILARKANDLTAQNIIKMLVTLSNVEKTEVYYRWDLIESDKDDNKFVDCAITGNVDYLVVFWCRAKSCCWTRFARPGVIRYFEHHLKPL